LAVRCVVQKSRPSSNVKVKGQRSRSPGQKNEKCGILFWSCPLGCGPRAAFFSGAVFGGAVLCQFYAGGKISACRLVTTSERTRRQQQTRKLFNQIVHDSEHCLYYQLTTERDQSVIGRYDLPTDCRVSLQRGTDSKILFYSLFFIGSRPSDHYFRSVC